MQIIIFILGFLYLQFDMSLLKRRALSLYQETFKLTSFQAILWALFLGTALLVLQAEVDSGVVFAIMILAGTGIYALKRQEFFKRLSTHPEFAVSPEEKLQLALSTFGLLGLWILGVLVVQVIVTAIFEGFNPSYDELGPLLLVSEVSSILFIVLIYNACREYKTFNFSEVMGLETKGLGFVKTWLLPAGFAFAYALLASKILLSRPIQPVTPLQEMIDSTSSISLILMFVGTAILTAPFFEEIIFRGFFFYVIRPFKGALFAISFVALSFGLLHVEQYWGDWHAITIVGLFGLSLTLMREWTGSAVPGMIAHYVYNTCLTIIPVIAILVSNPVYLDYQLNYYRLNDSQKEEKLVRSIEAYPEFYGAYNDLAWLYAEQGIKLERALELIDQALVSEPESYAFLDTKAEVLYKLWRLEEAIAIEESLLQKYPNDEYIKKQLEKFRQGLVVPPPAAPPESRSSLAPEADPDSTRLKIY